jgi:hypothetical protein
MPRRLMNPMSSRKLSADAEQRVLRVQEVVVPDDRALARRLAAVHTQGSPTSPKSVEAERLEEAEIRVDAGDLVAIARRPGGLPREKDRADVRVAQDVAPSAQHGVVCRRRGPSTDWV